MAKNPRNTEPRDLKAEENPPSIWIPMLGLVMQKKPENTAF